MRQDNLGGDLGSLDVATLLQYPAGAGGEDQGCKPPTLQRPRRGIAGGPRPLKQEALHPIPPSGTYLTLAEGMGSSRGIMGEFAK